MRSGATLMLALVTAIELAALAGGITLVRRGGRARSTSNTTFGLAGAPTMSERTFGWWLIGTSLLLLLTSGYLAARFHA